MAKNASIDLGYGWTKARIAGNLWRQPSTLGEVKPLFDEQKQRGDMIYNGTYFVGHLAARHSDVKYTSTKDNKAETWTTEVLLKAALGNLAPEGQLNLVTGLPIDFFFKQKQPFTELLNRFNDSPPYNLEVFGQGTKAAKPVIVKHKIVPQPLGTAMGFLLDERGELVSKAEAKKRLLVIDLGRWTLDLLVLDAMEIGKESYSPPGLGTEAAYKLLQQYLREQIGKAPGRHDMDRLLLDQTYEGYDIRPLIAKAFKALADQIQLEVEGLNMNFYRYLITGGNAGIIAEYLDLPNKEVFDQLGNLNGYAKIGARLWGGI